MHTKRCSSCQTSNAREGELWQVTVASRLIVGAMTAKLLRTQWWPSSRITEYQMERLDEVTRFAAAEVPFYQGKLSQHETLATRERLALFPVLSKADVQRAGSDIQALHVAPGQVYKSCTSGSTGEPTITLFDERCWLKTRYALKARRLLNALRQPRLRLLAFTESVAADADRRDSHTRSKSLFDVRQISFTTPADEAIRRISAYRPTMLQGYPSILEHICDTAMQQQQQLPQVSHVFTSSELLTDRTRESLADGFGARIIDIYGSTEFKEIAVQCGFGRYHVNFESVYVEAVANPGSSRKRLLITSLLNKAMPLIRYDIGDFGEVASGKCDCGREGPYLYSLDGRHSELLQFPSGEVLSGYSLTLAIEEFPEIKSYSFVQHSPVSLGLSVFSEPRLSPEHRNELSARITKLLPAGVRLSIQLLDSRLPAGKRVAVRRAF